MMNYYRTGRRDSNEKAIKDYLDKKGIEYLSLYPSQGADLQLLLKGGVVFVEVKNPVATDKRKAGTATERMYQQLCKKLDIVYLVVSSVDEIAVFLNLWRIHGSATVSLL